MDTSHCCICLSSKNSVQNITLVDESNVKLSEKLQYIAPEVEWLDEYSICQSCANALNSACRFKSQCLSVSLQKNHLKVEVSDDANYSNDVDNENDNYSSDNTKEESNEDKHGIFNEGNDFFVCYDCGDKCTTKEELINHIKKAHAVWKEDINSTENELNCERNGVHRERDFQCTKCGRKYVLKTTLSQHMRNCDGIKRHGKAKSDYQCENCLKYYSTQKILKAHKKNCDPETESRKTDFQCTKCNKYYISSKTLKDHYKRGCKKDKGGGSKVFFCKICDEYFKSVLTLKQHILTEHKTSTYICDICIINFDSKEEYEAHNNTKHASDNDDKITKRRGRVSTRKFTCEVCNKEFTLLKSIIEHCVDSHSMDKKTIRPYSCGKCDNRFRSSTNLINHMLYHDRNRTNICSFCGKSFITKNDLTAHENIHFNRRNYKCNKCEKAFKTNTNLRTHHLIVHTDPSLWKYMCQICSKRFPQKSNHDQHLRRHIGVKNFICPLCRKPFASKSEMQEHVSYHSNVRAYKCATCGKEYRKKHTYEVHLTKVHGIGNIKIPVREKKHACHICPSRFYDKVKLARHLCTHSGLKPYPCYACDKKFTDKSYLKHHLKTSHNIIEERKYEWNK